MMGSFRKDAETPHVVPSLEKILPMPNQVRDCAGEAAPFPTAPQRRWWTSMVRGLVRRFRRDPISIPPKAAASTGCAASPFSSFISGAWG